MGVDVNVEFEDGGKTLTVSAKVDRTVRTGSDNDVTGSAAETSSATEPATTDASTVTTTAEADKTWHSYERSFGRFSRSFTFAEPVDADSTTARYEDGVVKVVVPKLAPPRAEDRQTVRIE